MTSTSIGRKFGSRKVKLFCTCNIIFASMLLWSVHAYFTYFFGSYVVNTESKKVRSFNTYWNSLSLEDSCTGRVYNCEIHRKKFSYVYFLTSPSSPAVSAAGSPKKIYENLTYYDYTYASISRLSDLTDLPILIMVTSDISETEASGLRSISPQVLMKQVSPGYLKYSINTTKKRHIHTFGKYEVFNPENTMNFERLFFMVSFKSFFLSCK